MPDQNMTTFMKHISAALAEEEKDANKYMDMAAMAPEEYKPILLDIAEEEGIHQMHLATIMHDMKKHMAHSSMPSEEQYE